MTRHEKIRKKIEDALRLIRHEDLRIEMALTRAFNDGLALGIELQTIQDDETPEEFLRSNRVHETAEKDDGRTPSGVFLRPGFPGEGDWEELGRRLVETAAKGSQRRPLS